MSLWQIVTVLGALSIAVAAQANAPQERRPNFPISIANPAPAGAERSGVLFKQIDQLSLSRSEEALINALATDVKIGLYPKTLDILGDSEIRKFLRVLLMDCQGPYSIDEAVTWVQTSWVCHIGDDRSIKSYFGFKESPEISVQFTFADGQIQKIFAAEVMALPFPGASKYLPKNAAETMPDKR